MRCITRLVRSRFRRLLVFLLYAGLLKEREYNDDALLILDDLNVANDRPYSVAVLGLRFDVIALLVVKYFVIVWCKQHLSDDRFTPLKSEQFVISEFAHDEAHVERVHV